MRSLRNAGGVGGLLASLLLFSAAVAAPQRYDDPQLLTTLDAKFINEASGIADSRTNPGIIWLHNDSGDGPFLYGVDHEGHTRAVFQVRDAQAIDWEDMSIGPGPDGKGIFVYMGDIGDNQRRRADYTIYRFAEPKLPATPGSKARPNLIPTPTVRRTFVYPDGPHNAEALFCHPKTGTLYIVTKEESGISGVYRFPKETTPVQQKLTLIRIATITMPDEAHPFPRLVTSGAISPDGKHIALQTYDAVYELDLPAGAKDFDSIWKQKLNRIPIALMKQAEGICYTKDGKALLETSEKLPTPIYELKRHQ